MMLLSDMLYSFCRAASFAGTAAARGWREIRKEIKRFLSVTGRSSCTSRHALR
jgi:hypothetical protein